MFKVEIADLAQVELLATLSRRTYIESHAHFIHDANDLNEYVSSSFTQEKIRIELEDPNSLFYIAWLDGVAIGYIKLLLDAANENIAEKYVCRLERIYVLKDYISQKIGQRLIDFVFNLAKTKAYKKIWLTVYVKNDRAIRFYERNKFYEVGSYNFLVNKTEYENIVFAKDLV